MFSILLGNFEVEDFLFDGEADTAMAMAFLVAYVILGACVCLRVVALCVCGV